MNKIRCFIIILFSVITFFSKSQSLSLYNFNSDSTVFKNDFQLYLIGENHAYKKNNLVLTEIRSALRTNTPMNNLLIEAGVSVDYLLYYFKKDKRTEFYYNGDYKINIVGFEGRNIYKYISGTSIENTNHFFIDIEADPKIANIALLDILTRYNESNVVKEISNSLHEKIDILNFERKELEISKIMVDSLFPKTPLLKDVISDVDFKYLVLIIENLKKGIEFRSIKDKILADKYREENMFVNIKKLLELNPEKKYIGSIGQFHILDTLPNVCFARVCNWASMAYKLKKEFKVCVIASYHKKKKFQFTELITGKLEVNSKLLTINGEDHFDSQKKEFIFKFLEANSKSEFNLFPLSSEYIYDPGNYYNYIIYCK